MSNERNIRLCERIVAHCRENQWYFFLESYQNLFNPVPFDLEQHEKTHGHPRLIRLSEREWPTFF